MAVGVGLGLSTIVEALVGIGLRPLGVGLVQWEDKAGDGDDGGEDEEVCGCWAGVWEGQGGLVGMGGLAGLQVGCF